MTRRPPHVADPALIETVRIRAGRAPLWYLHLRRLSESCVALGVPLPAAFDVPAGGADRVLRLEVGRRGMQAGERAVGSAAPVVLRTVSEPHVPYPHKLTAREAFERAGAEARAAGADDALLLTGDGLVAECAIWTLLWWEAEGLAGPPAALGILRSVARMRLEELAGPVRERAVGPGELAGRSLVVANAARGLAPVAALDGVAVPGDPRTARLADRFWS